MDVNTGVDVDVGAGDGVVVGAPVGARGAVGDGATEGVDVALGTVVATSGVDVGIGAGEGVSDGNGAGVKVAVGDGPGLAVGVRVEVGPRVGSDASLSGELVVGVPAESGISVERLSTPRAGVNVSNAWTVAMRISSALFLCMARAMKNVNTTDNIAMANP